MFQAYGRDEIFKLKFLTQKTSDILDLLSPDEVCTLFVSRYSCHFASKQLSHHCVQLVFFLLLAQLSKFKSVSWRRLRPFQVFAVPVTSQTTGRSHWPVGSVDIGCWLAGPGMLPGPGWPATDLPWCQIKLDNVSFLNFWIFSIIKNECIF